METSEAEAPMPDRIQSTQEISRGFYLLTCGFVSVYIVDAGDSLIAFDAGMSPRRLVSEMKKLNLDPEKVSTVFFTHCDPDHTGGIKAFPNAQSYFSTAEVAMFDHTIARFFGMVYAKPPRFSYGTVEDGQELRIGAATVRCISTPGHTCGSMSFLIDGSLLIVGDELNLKHGRAVLDRKFISVDNDARLRSIHALAKLIGVKIICTAHSGYSRDFEKAMAAWKE
jgi:glyoxylase-like metal-dependent hydrolase (beta-lactamase superfamily II)